VHHDQEARNALIRPGSY